MFARNVYIAMLVGLGLLGGSGFGQVTAGRILGMVFGPERRHGRRRGCGCSQPGDERDGRPG